MNSFLGGSVGFGSDVPDYGSIGPGYTGDYFGPTSSKGISGGAILQELGRGVLGGLSSFGSGSQGYMGTGAPGYNGMPSASSGGYADRTKQDMQNLLAMALRAFPAPRSVI